MPESPESNRILNRMLERLFGSLMSGPALNCRPHSSRQRIDLTQLARLQDVSPSSLLPGLLSQRRAVKVAARTPLPPPKPVSPPDEPTLVSDELALAQRAAEAAWNEQRGVLNKLRTIAEDALEYEQDTGVHVLSIGFPLLSIPPGALGAASRAISRRIVAPIAFIPVELTIKGGLTPSVELRCKAQGVDLVIPNAALMAWLEQQSGKAVGEPFADDDGEKPWSEIGELTRLVATQLGLTVSAELTAALADEEKTELALEPVPRNEDLMGAGTILCSAVLGLYPMPNQGLLRDMQALVDGEPARGPIESFLRADATIAGRDAPRKAAPPTNVQRPFCVERLVAASDPCQSRAVRLARECSVLVIHGPPGTGKSQTITNIIGDHLGRGERVLFVCDKRTALDVVANRLEHLGLGRLCATVHDPRRDQRDLYRSIREQLDALSETTSDASAADRVARADEELLRLHGELSQHRAALMGRNGHALSFHELMGEWLHLPSEPEGNAIEARLASASLEQLDASARVVHEVLERATEARYHENVWVQAAGAALADFLAGSMDHHRRGLQNVADAARRADDARDADIPAFDPGAPVQAQAAARVSLAEQLESVLAGAEAAVLSRWGGRDSGAVRSALQQLSDSAALVDVLRSGPLDAELALTDRNNTARLADVQAQSVVLSEYTRSASKWYAFLYLGRRRRAAEVLQRYGLPLTPDNAARVQRYLSGLRARLVLTHLHHATLRETAGPDLLSDGELERSLVVHRAVLDLLGRVSTEPALRGLETSVRGVLKAPETASRLLHGLGASAARATCINAVRSTMAESGVLSEQWISEIEQKLRRGEAALETTNTLLQRLDSLENVLRVRELQKSVPASLAPALADLVQAGVPADRGAAILRKAVLAVEIRRRLQNEQILQSMDAQRLRSIFERFRALDSAKRDAVRDAILHRWISLQRERLLAGTGSRLNSLGAEIKRRLVLRGERALKLRQVIALGANTEGGDPLVDLRPIWMASPETVAQVFPREALFDVVIFDEASQCRLEEALPVLTRGRRVVIAGDPRQLPPSRFFESAVAQSEQEEIETDQDLFESQQAETEDLLAAALNLEIDEAYLDVHYRSRNADLIEFSNRQFYDARLQPIPGHPARRARSAPVLLHRVDGVYEKQTNASEAERVCAFVQKLLAQAEPPSIGVACFNVAQRDLILEKLDDAAAEDERFARQLREARQRRGAGSFEGLFVKNLENVQGDERDYILISTTYGPDPNGRFYQRFGPLGQAGGGRRLNVLVTRAREEVHVFTSIPAERYRGLPPPQAGKTPSGAWLLYAYLKFAEDVAALYEPDREDDAARTDLKTLAATVRKHRSRYPSTFSAAMADFLAARHGVGSDVLWGNDGFCVDLALHHPRSPGDVTVGVLCDACRFEQAVDPVEWDLFRTAILESQGWKLHRLWTPHFFRDMVGGVNSVLRDADLFLAASAATERCDGLAASTRPDPQTLNS